MSDLSRPAAPLVVLRHVDVRYGTRLALSDVTLTLPHGATGLLGSNGAGKSTLLCALLGLITPHSGHIEVLGCDVASHPVEARARLGYVPERAAYVPGLNAIASVAYCGELAGLPSADAVQRAHEVLWYVGLNEARYRRVETFSTGMKQRLKLAQALVHDPDLLLLDEPTDGMDPQGRREMLALVWDLSHRRGLSVLFSSHLLPDIERTCDTVIVLDHGVVVRTGGIAEWRRASTPRVHEVRIKGDRSAFIAALAGLRVECETDDGDVLTLATAGCDARPIFEAARRAGVQIRHLRRKVPSLEELFETVTAGSTLPNAAGAEACPESPRYNGEPAAVEFAQTVPGDSERGLMTPTRGTLPQ